jgi:hypothetical protein
MSFIRRLKPAYAFYNMFQRRRLLHNVALYEKLGLRKSYFSPISSRDFARLPPSDSTTAPEPLAQRLTAVSGFGELPAATQASLLSFEEQGFAVLQGFFAPATVDALNTELDALVASGKLKFRYRNKLMFAFRQSALVNQAAHDARLLGSSKALTS